MKKVNLWRGKNLTVFHFVGVALAVLAVALFSLSSGEKSEAASPTGGIIGDTVGTSITWMGTQSGVPPAGNGEPSCSTGDATATNCDVYILTVSPGNWAGKRIKVNFNWNTIATDYDMSVRTESNGVAGFQGDGLTVNTPPLDAVVATSGNGTNTFEEVVLSPPNTGGIYYVRAIYFAGGGPSDQYRGSATVESTSTTAPPSACTLPTFDNFQPPVGFPKRDNAGEPSIGINWNTNNVMTMARLQPNRTTFDDSTSPANPTTGTNWFARSLPTVVTGLDPIGFTDPVTGRSLFGELNGNFTNGLVSDDDLATFTPLPTQGISPTSSVDHQTIGGGPPNPNIIGRQPTGSYPHLVYYAAQNVAVATVATSFDGGITYAPAVPAYNVTQCGGLHGHIKVAPDGTVYLPNKGCNGKTGVAVSEDNGLTWVVRTIPTSTAGNTDPSVGIGAGGRVYLAYAGGDNRPHVAISDNKGVTWHDDFDLSQSISPNLTAIVFPHAVAGDNNRAAIFFLGTNSTNPGDPVGDDASTVFAGTWYPYVATTCDGGVSWSVVRADNDPLRPGLPNPVQQGVVCTNGTTCPGGPPNTRNLLDFNELGVDSRGRITAVYADGCNAPHPCINITDNSGNKSTNQGTARLTILRQRGGMRLFGAFDPGGPAAPSLSPPVFVNEIKGHYQVKWTTPDDGGSPLTSYRIYRGIAGQGETLIAQVRPGVFSYLDRRTNTGGRGVYYRVTAVNAYGESPRNVKNFSQ